MTKSASETFSKRFLWGASISAHQAEGGTHNQWTVWELENAKALAAQAEYQFHDLPSWKHIGASAQQPENYVSAKASRHYERYSSDFDLLEKLHMNAFRFSIEWSRIEPQEGVWDPREVTYYKNYIADLKKRGIEPVVTLFHNTLPVWFEQRGGFARRSNVKYFVRFVEHVMTHLTGDVRYIITINEPEIYAYSSFKSGTRPPQHRSTLQFIRVLNNLVFAHKQAARVIHSHGRRHKVSIAKYSMFVYPGDNAWLSRLSAWFIQYFQDDYFLGRVVKHCDFLGVNYYTSARVYGYRIHNPDLRLSDMGWDLSPANLEFVLERLYARYRLPIIVTENGLADATDAQRKWWLEQTITALHGAIRRQIPVEGYLHWSLIDNFEWEHGTWPRFGLAAVDYKTGERELRPSAQWFARVIKKLRRI